MHILYVWQLKRKVLHILKVIYRLSFQIRMTIQKPSTIQSFWQSVFHVHAKNLKMIVYSFNYFSSSSFLLYFSWNCSSSWALTVLTGLTEDPLSFLTCKSDWRSCLTLFSQLAHRAGWYTVHSTRVSIFGVFPSALNLKTQIGVNSEMNPQNQNR